MTINFLTNIPPQTIYCFKVSSFSKVNVVPISCGASTAQDNNSVTVFRHHFKLQFRIRRRAADRFGAKLDSYVASPPIPDTHINTPSPALFSDNHPVCRTHLRLPSDDLASVQWQCVCIICPDLVSSSRAETTDNMSSHPVNTDTTHSHYHGGAHLLVSSG